MGKEPANYVLVRFISSWWAQCATSATRTKNSWISRTKNLMASSRSLEQISSEVLKHSAEGLPWLVGGGLLQSNSRAGRSRRLHTGRRRRLHAGRRRRLHAGRRRRLRARKRR